MKKALSPDSKQPSHHQEREQQRAATRMELAKPEWQFSIEQMASSPEMQDVVNRVTEAKEKIAQVLAASNELTPADIELFVQLVDRYCYHRLWAEYTQSLPSRPPNAPNPDIVLRLEKPTIDFWFLGSQETIEWQIANILVQYDLYSY